VRVVFIAPPSAEELEARLRKDGALTEEEIQHRLKATQEEIDQSSSGDLCDKVITNDDLETAYKALEEFIYENPEAHSVYEDDASDGDTAMKDQTTDSDTNLS
jgi:guanylate kinase